MSCDDASELRVPPLSPLIHPPTPRSLSDAGDDDIVDPLDDSGRLSPLSTPVFNPIPSNASPKPSFHNHNLDSVNTITNVTNTFSPANRRTSVASSNSTNSNPFNFQPMVAAKGPIGSPKPNQRRGHKYKHSSVSHQIFLEPPVRAPLSLPASLPIPTVSEFLSSVTANQRLRSLWCLCHLGVAGYVLMSAGESLAMTALSHLLTFDAMGAMLCVCVDVLSNFEVWKRSTIRHPFGLERAEVLAGFAMSVFLLFMGFDTISHSVEHFLEAMGVSSHSSHSKAPGAHGPKDTHNAHTEHVATALTASHLDLPALAALAATLISASVLKNHSRIGKATAWSDSYLSSLPSILSNPSHLLTLVCSTLMLLLPMLSVSLGSLADALVGISMALSMVAIGVNIAKSLGSMLLLSFGGRGRVAGIVEEIKADDRVLEVAEARFWQAHYGLGIGTVRVVCRGEGRGVEEMVRRIVEQTLGGKGIRWEVTVGVVGK